MAQKRSNKRSRGNGQSCPQGKHGDFRLFAPYASRAPGPPLVRVVQNPPPDARPRGFLPKTSRQGDARLCTRPSRHATRLLPHTRSVRQIVLSSVLHAASHAVFRLRTKIKSSKALTAAHSVALRGCIYCEPARAKPRFVREPCAQHCCSAPCMRQPPRASRKTNGRPRPKLL